jgi:hypothetical protein
LSSRVVEERPLCFLKLPNHGLPQGGAKPVLQHCGSL